MKKLLKFIVWLLGLSVFLLLTAHFTLRYALNTPKFKAAATGFIERATGRVATYDRIDYSLFPFSLMIRNAELMEQDGTTPFASIEEFAAIIDFRKKEVTSLRLLEPSVRILQYADGSFNFSDLIAEEPETSEPDATPAESSTPVEPAKPTEPVTASVEEAATEPFSVKLVQIDRAELVFVRVDAENKETPFTLTDLNFQLLDFAPDQPFRMRGNVTIGKTSAFEFSLSGPALAEYAKRLGEWPIALDAKADLRDFADLKAFLPEGTLPFHSLALGLQLAGSLKDGLQLTADLTTPDATKDFPVAMDLKLQADLALPSPVLQHLLGGEALPESYRVQAPPCELPPGTLTLATLPMESLLIQHAKANATLTFPTIAYGLNRLEQGQVTAQLANGILTLPTVKMKAYTGTIEARGSIQLLACPLTYQLEQLSATHLEIAQVVAANGIEAAASFSGTLQLKASARGSAISEEGLSTLQAEAQAQIDDLQSVGDNGSLLDQIWLKLDNPLLLKLVPRIQGKVDQAKVNAATVCTSHYEEATATLAMRDGTVTLSDTRLSAPNVRVDLSGTVRLPENQLDLRAQLVLSPEETERLTEGKDLSAYLPYEKGGLMIPIALTGPLEKPTVLPDFDRLLKNALEGTVTEQLTPQLDKLHSKDKKNVEEGLQLLQGLFK
jgi:AsmA-like C-terminal region